MNCIVEKIEGLVKKGYIHSHGKNQHSTVSGQW